MIQMINGGPYTDVYHEAGIQVLLSEHSINDFLDKPAGERDTDIDTFMNNGSG
ncbi:hypothetical protein RhiirC2_780970 [Rhizophagus irregularis]|uniref:Uncharacterized protein n=1 Tax=Rhizophagus irregularis TaxID=588596 RepID=A0A2N1N6K7_9GLOM|nr:hypothetical protein RhiirC2_780970 [Rhizophagus irregularis]